MIARLLAILLTGLFLFFSPGLALAQQQITIEFAAAWQNIPVKKQSAITDTFSGQVYRFAKIKQYISGIAFLRSGIPVGKDTGYYLIDFLDEKSCRLQLEYKSLDFDEIQFLTGIDSLMQTRGVQGGALDPVNGMYWTWQSGYIHTKIEAGIEQNGKVKPLEFHLGGYRHPYNTVQRAAVKCAASRHVSLVFNLSPIVKYGEEKQCFRVMSPCKQAAEFSNVWSESVSSIP